MRAVVALWLAPDGGHVVSRDTSGARWVRVVGEPGPPVLVLTAEVIFDRHHGAGWCPWCGAPARVALGVGAVVLGCCGGRAWPLPAWPEEGRITRPTRRPAWRWSR